MFNFIVTLTSGQVWSRHFPDSWRALESDEEKSNPFKNTLNFKYRVLVGLQYPRVFKSGKTYTGVDIKILEIIAEQQNTKILQVELPDGDNNITFNLMRYNADLTVLTTINYDNGLLFKSIVTNDENAYCALVPKPPRLSLLHLLLKPFDGWCWVIMIVSILVCAFLWQRISKSYRSTSAFTFFLAASFLGKYVKLKIEKRVLVVLAQLCVLVAMIMGNAYQSMITSYLTTSRDGVRFDTFDELLDSHLYFKADEKFRNYVRHNLKKSVTDRIAPLTSFEILTHDEPVAIIHSCDQLRHILNVNNTFLLGEKFYLISETVLKYSEKLYLSQASPLYEILKLGFDHTFESGIRQYWQKQMKPREFAVLNRELSFLLKEEYFLTMADICGVFWILAIGHGIAVLALILEFLHRRICSCKM